MAHTEVDYATVGGMPFGGYGYNGGGFGGAGFLGGLVLGGLAAGGRRGGLFGGDDCGGDGKALAFQLGEAKGENAKYRDVVDATQAINSLTIATAKEGVDVTRATGAVLGTQLSELKNGQWVLSKEICDNRHEQAMQFAAVQKDMALQHCAIEKMISCDGEKTRAMLVQQNENRLLDKLEAERFAHNETMRQRDLLATGNFPISQPAHVHKHHDCGTDQANQINIINQNVNALGSIVGQQADAVNKILAALAAKA